MKKLMSVVACLGLSFFLVGCGNDKDKKPATDAKKEVKSETKTEKKADGTETKTEKKEEKTEKKTEEKKPA